MLAFIDCLQSIKFAVILTEIGNEHDASEFAEWFEQQVRGRPQKMDQLRQYCNVCAWKIALALRAKVDYGTITKQIIQDNQALQDALSRETQTTERKKNGHANSQAGHYNQTWKGSGKKGKGKGKATTGGSRTRSLGEGAGAARTRRGTPRTNGTTGRTTRTASCTTARNRESSGRLVQADPE